MKGMASLVAGAMVLVLAGCGASPDPMTLDEQATRVAEDRTVLFAEQEPITKPITLYEAMARALKYNLDHRLKLMENALARKRLTSANLSLLPSLTAEAGYSGRNNFSGSNSRSLLTGVESLESSTSSDRDLQTFDLTMSWNILDFGVSLGQRQPGSRSRPDRRGTPPQGGAQRHSGRAQRLLARGVGPNGCWPRSARCPNGSSGRWKTPAVPRRALAARAAGCLAGTPRPARSAAPAQGAAARTRTAPRPNWPP